MPNEYEPIKDWVRDVVSPKPGESLVPVEEVIDPVIEVPKKEEPKVEVLAPVVDPKVEELKKEDPTKGVADVLAPASPAPIVPTPEQK